MGIVVTFPESRRVVRGADLDGVHGPSATIVILPVVRIERHADTAAFGCSVELEVPARKRRRRATRSRAAGRAGE